MFKWVYRIRYLSLVAVVCSFAASFLMFIVGAVKTYTAGRYYLFGLSPSAPAFQNVDKADLATKSLVGSVDAFLFALILMIFAFGIYNLFVTPLARIEQKTPFWLSIRSVGHLKSTLAELIIIILFVKFLELVLIDIQSLTWETLILPLAIGLLALAMKLLDLRHDVDVFAGEQSRGESEKG